MSPPLAAEIDRLRSALDEIKRYCGHCAASQYIGAPERRAWLAVARMAQAFKHPKEEEKT